MLANATFLKDFLVNIKKVETESMDESEMAINKRRFAKILSASTPGFNRLKVIDDKGYNFYDHFPDMPRESFAGDEGRREITLTLTGKKAFYLLSSEEDQYPGISLDPVHVYKEDYTPTDLNIDGTVTYTGLNSVPAIGGSARLMTKVFGGRWKNEELFLLTSPVYLRPVDASTGLINLKTPPRTPTFIGKVNQNDLQALNSTEVSIMNTHPMTGSNYNGPDNFFRTLPPVGGASPFVKVEAVRIYRLELRAGKENGYGDLYLSAWKEGVFVDDAEPVVRNAKQVKITRDTVTMPLINLEVEK